VRLHLGMSERKVGRTDRRETSTPLSAARARRLTSTITTAPAAASGLARMCLLRRYLGYRPLNVVAVGQSVVVKCGDYKEGRRRAVETYAGSSLGKHIRSLSQKIVLLRALQMGGCSRLPFTYLNGLTSSQSSRRAACLGLSAHEILRYSAKL
jgi:hypothetical protein